MPIYEQKAVAVAKAGISVSLTSQSFCAANTDRLCLILYNSTAKECYLKFGANGDTVDYNLILPPDGYYEVPAFWQGEVSGAWDNPSDSGTLIVSEFTK